VYGKLAVYSGNSAAQWCQANSGDARMPSIRDQVSSVPQALWLGLGFSRDWAAGYVSAAVAAQSLPQLVLYGFPSLGGTSTAQVQAYRSFVDTAVAAIGSAPCVVIIEPDSLIQCLGLSGANPFRLQRAGLLQYAVYSLASKCLNTWTYLDAGDGFYSKSSDMVPLLMDAGISLAQGFSVNISNVNPTSMCVSFGASVNSGLYQCGVSAKSVLIDVSRNGNGRPSDAYIQAHKSDWWQNTPGSKLGARPSTTTKQIWVKHPGESDGPGGIVTGIDSGVFDPRLAVALINGSMTA
jgi:endoglucanase